MKKIVLMFGLLIGFTAVAQEKKMMMNERSQESRIENRLEKATKELDLSKEQQVKVKELLEKRSEAFEEQREERDEARKLRKEQHDAFDAEFKSILTPDQVAKYEESKKAKTADREIQRRGMHKSGATKGSQKMLKPVEK